jgi:hypothetical protein
MGRPPTISESHFDTPPPEVMFIWLLRVDLSLTRLVCGSRMRRMNVWAPHRSDPAAVDFKPVPEPYDGRLPESGEALYVVIASPGPS